MTDEQLAEVFDTGYQLGMQHGRDSVSSAYELIRECETVRATIEPDAAALAWKRLDKKLENLTAEMRRHLGISDAAVVREKQTGPQLLGHDRNGTAEPLRYNHSGTTDVCHPTLIVRGSLCNPMLVYVYTLPCGHTVETELPPGTELYETVKTTMEAVEKNAQGLYHVFTESLISRAKPEGDGGNIEQPAPQDTAEALLQEISQLYRFNSDGAHGVLQADRDKFEQAIDRARKLLDK